MNTVLFTPFTFHHSKIATFTVKIATRGAPFQVKPRVRPEREGPYGLDNMHVSSVIVLRTACAVSPLAPTLSIIQTRRVVFDHIHHAPCLYAHAKMPTKRVLSLREPPVPLLCAELLFFGVVRAGCARRLSASALYIL
jgi:hypothetical protein